jgi:hypothetical protein
VSVKAPLRQAPLPATEHPRLLPRSAALPLTVRAFIASRVLVLVAGMLGTLLLTPHASPAVVRQSRALGVVGHLLAASVDRFDAGYYLLIARSGYGGAASPRIAFFPAYPVLIRAVAEFTRSPVIAGALISLVCFAVALVLLHRLAELELGPAAADATVLLLCCAPLSFFFSAIYSESLLLALTVGAFYAARQDRLQLACLLGAAATLTRPTGIAILGALLVVWWRSPQRRRRDLVWLALPAVALLAWMATLAATGHGLTGEFHAEHMFWGRIDAFPLQTVALALLGMAVGIVRLVRGATVYHPLATGPLTPSAQNVVLGAVLVLSLVTWEACRRRLRPEYAVYAGLVLIACLSSRFSGEPLDSFDRFALTIFPLWMVAGALLARRPRLLYLVCGLGAVALTFYTMQFSSWAFIA